MKNYLNRYPTAIFSILTILFSFGVYFTPLPRETLPFLMVLVPAVLALILAGITEGKAGVSSLFTQLGKWRISLKWYLLALLLAVSMRLAISLIALALGMIPALRLRPVTWVEAGLLAVLFLVAAIPEELGWRGYALPKLLKDHSPLYSSLVIGVLWGLVHLALHLTGMPSAGQPGALTMVQLIGLSVLLTWFYIRGENSLLLTSLFHAAQTFFVIFNEGVTLGQQVWLMALVWGAAAILVIATSRTMQGASILKQGYPVSEPRS